MPTYEIRGVEVQFPHEIYDVQRVYMERVIEALQKSQNALLESPTGTGKTLCLLTSTLAWREAYKKRQTVNGGMQAIMQAEDAVTTQPNRENWTKAPPRIIYTSRTHSQLSQVVQELRRTAYKPKICILGSREQMCIHEDVVQIDNAVGKNQVCKQKVQSRRCNYYNRLEGFIREHPQQSEVLADIEDLVQIGRTSTVCPYFLSRDNLNKAELIFAPYNYLIDASTRRAQGLDVSNSIIIFDEAHNLESSCGDAMSFEWTASDVAVASEEIKESIKVIEDLGEDVAGWTGGEAYAMLNVFFILDQALDEIKLDSIVPAATSTTGKESSLPGAVKKGSFIYDLLARMNVNPETCEILLAGLNKAIELITGATQKYKRGRKVTLQMFLETLQTLFAEGRAFERETLDTYYKVYITEMDTGSHNKKGKSIGFWCFNSGVAMRELLKKDVRSAILTSGTLAPLSSLATELQTEFKVQLENGHVIQPNQVWIGVGGKGPSGQKLNASYRTRSSNDYKNDLGSAIVNLCRIVPDGVLVFFPSYSVMDECLRTWQETASSGKNVWTRLSELKELVMEPKKKQDFAASLELFYNHIENCRKAQDQPGPETKTQRGAVLFAVCRGKVSEGIDFSDAKARAVIITGLPFPPFVDPKVVLKKSFLDDQLKKNSQDSKEFPPLSGDDWYKQQAARAVNQAIGRVIRHKNDYGAIVLLDERFSNPAMKVMLPMWVRQYVTVENSFGPLVSNLNLFFKNASKDDNLKPRPRRHISLDFEAPPVSSFAPLQRAVSAHHNASHLLVRSAPAITMPLPDYADESVVRKEDERERPSRRTHLHLFASVADKADEDTVATSTTTTTTTTATSATSLAVAPAAAAIAMASTIKEETKPSPDPQMAKEFIAKIKSLVKPEQSKRFFAALTEQRKGGTTMRPVLDFMWDSIPEDQRESIIQQFHIFITPNHSNTYDEFCTEHAIHNPLARRHRKHLPTLVTSSLSSSSSSSAIKRPTAHPDASMLPVSILKKPRLHPDDAARRELPTIPLVVSQVLLRRATTPQTLNMDSMTTDVIEKSDVSNEGGDAQSNMETNATRTSGTTCIVCNEKATAAHAAKCGHIACWACWQSVLARTLECPVCHDRTRQTHLRKLYFR